MPNKTNQQYFSAKFEFHSAILLQNRFISPPTAAWRLPTLTSVYILQVSQRASLTLESAGRDWIPLHILFPSLPCQPLWSGGRARCSTQQSHSSAAPGAPLCAQVKRARREAHCLDSCGTCLLTLCSRTPGDFHPSSSALKAYLSAEKCVGKSQYRSCGH